MLYSQKQYLNSETILKNELLTSREYQVLLRYIKALKLKYEFSEFELKKRALLYYICKFVEQNQFIKAYNLFHFLHVFWYGESKFFDLVIDDVWLSMYKFVKKYRSFDHVVRFADKMLKWMFAIYKRYGIKVSTTEEIFMRECYKILMNNWEKYILEGKSYF